MKRASSKEGEENEPGEEEGSESENGRRILNPE